MGFLRLENNNVAIVKKILIQENQFKKNRQNFPDDKGMQALNFFYFFSFSKIYFFHFFGNFFIVIFFFISLLNYSYKF